MSTLTQTQISTPLSTQAPTQKALRAYAKLLVNKGAALQQGQELVLRVNVEAYDFARIVVDEAYQAGAGHVTLIWEDDVIMKLNFTHVDLEWFKTLPSWKKEQLNSLAEAGASFLFLIGNDPNALADVDPQKPAALSKATNMQALSYRQGMDFGKNVWCIGGVPTRTWAEAVFPKASPEDAYNMLWHAILQVARVEVTEASDAASAAGEPRVQDPLQAWDLHNQSFEKQASFMNEHKFVKLHYQSANGTDLTLTMNPAHVWEGGSAKTVSGTVFNPNIPTEEVFTTPNWRGTSGTVYSALPLVHLGQVVEDFWFTFEEGRVVDHGARRGKEVLTQILKTDDQARYLGECALVSKNTPIRQTGVLFLDTLYDENAACHLALGMGFPECLEGGLKLDKQGLLAAGVNQSDTHVDFMIGAEDLSITGICADGTEIPVFVNGAWAWEQ